MHYSLIDWKNFNEKPNKGTHVLFAAPSEQGYVIAQAMSVIRDNEHCLIFSGQHELKLSEIKNECLWTYTRTIRIEKKRMQ